MSTIAVIINITTTFDIFTKYMTICAIRVINTVLSGASALLCGFCYSNIWFLDTEIQVIKGDMKYRSMIAMKCFISGKLAAAVAK